jgi:hypothetical protein
VLGLLQQAADGVEALLEPGSGVPRRVAIQAFGDVADAERRLRDLLHEVVDGETGGAEAPGGRFGA